jgi:hypothetical protein
MRSLEYLNDLRELLNEARLTKMPKAEVEGRLHQLRVKYEEEHKNVIKRSPGRPRRY